MIRKIKLSYNEFGKPSTFQTERFNKLLKSKDDLIFSDKFFEMVDRRRTDLGKLEQTIFFLQVPTFMFLALVLSGSDVNLSLFGLAAGKNLREALVLVSSGLGLWVAAIAAQKQTLANLIRAKNNKLAKGDHQIDEMLNAGYGLEPLFWSTPTSVHLNISRWHIFFGVMFALAAIGMVIAVLLGIMYVHLATLFQIYAHPNFTITATVVVIAFVLLADTIAFSWMMLSSGLLPYKSTERMKRLSKMMESNSEKSNKIFDGIIKRQNTKSLLMRLITRPTIPKDV